jgi:hypothetical protein
MSIESMKVRVEVWPLAADEAGIWLCSGDDAWRSPLAVDADSEPHAEVEQILSSHGVMAGVDLALVHSTSWRAEGQAVILTYVAVLACPGPIHDVCVGPIRGHWPEARPVGEGLARFVGRPATHAATNPPAPRYSDVLMHAVRHLRFLMDTDATAAEAMGEQWRPHLDRLSPSLAGLYAERHDQAA